jgi:hypothetical protein
MKFVGWVAAASVLSALTITALLGERVEFEVWLGMAGPLVAELATWVVVERTHKRRPEQVSGQLLRAFLGKVVFFGVYVAVALTAGPVRPLPFVVSFTGYFLALHLTAAVGLRRLFATG